jgi:predicted transcriptional regulator
MSTTSLKLSDELKQRAVAAAERKGVSPHAFMVQAIANSVRSVQLRESFAEDSVAALSDMKASGEGFELNDVRTYFAQMSAHRKGLVGKPAMILPKRLS